MGSQQGVLSLFHPLIARWFAERIGAPTDVQRQAWPEIAAGGHILITAPTGSGKTLAAFLYAINQLVTGKWTKGNTRVLYVSPLRALNNDIQRNLIVPLSQLKEYFEEAGEPFPEIRVLTRSGDTPQADRRRMLRRPPEILITTPESLNLLLSSPLSRTILTHLVTVILDEIHGVIHTKRGVYLITAVERLVRLAGEFQRISLSATVRPLKTVADFIGGFKMEGLKGPVRYDPRMVGMIQARANKIYNLRIRAPEEPRADEIQASSWAPHIRELKRIIGQNRSTLIFVNSRRLCEFLTLKINADEEKPVAYAHHGSLSLEIRSEVEKKLKAGELKAIVATNSLELGIDIGSLDEVVLVQSPSSISSAIQRIGRAGHQVGEISRGTFLPSHAKDILESSVLAAQVWQQNIEQIKPVQGPLDVLAQMIVSMVGVETWKLDDLFAFLKTSSPYRHLTRKQFDLVLNMLAGRYAGSRIRELRARVSIDSLDQTIEARRGALQDIYLSGGVIPDRGYFHLRHQETNSRIGDLDEEFVWEALVGDTFTLGTQSWQIQKITHNEVFVLPGNPKMTSAPFWRGEENNRDFHFSDRIGQFLEKADGRIEEPGFLRDLQKEHFLEETAASKLIEFLKNQKEATGSRLPHRHHIVMEFVASGPGGFPGSQVVIHTLWGGRVNRPFALALQAAWEARFGHRLEVHTSNDCVVLILAQEVSAEEILSLVGSDAVETLLRRRLEHSGFFGARFRECAGRALLLSRSRFRERMPLWMSRLRSQKLFDAVLGYEDFPILLEAWRTCLQDEFDLHSLKTVLREVETGVIGWSEVHLTHASPFAQSDWWRQVNQYMYMDDQPVADKVSRLRGSLIRELALTPGLRPQISRELVKKFEGKRQRLNPGYSPQTAREIIDWVKERVVLPEREWQSLLQAVRRDHGVEFTDLLPELKDKLVRFRPQAAEESLIASRELWPRILGSLYGEEIDRRPETLEGFLFPEASGEISENRGEEGDETSLLGEWIQFYGPRKADFIRKTLGLGEEKLLLTLEDLIDSQKVIRGGLVVGGEEEVCDSENFEILLRMARAEAIPVFDPLEIEWLPLFLADHQGITKPQDNRDGFYQVIERLLLYPADAEAWEEEIFPARARPYDPSWLDSLMQQGDLKWIGKERHQVAFCFAEDLDLLGEEELEVPPADADEDFSEDLLPFPVNPYARLFPDPAGRYDFGTLLRLSRDKSSALAEQLWEGVWKGRVTNDSFLPLRQAIRNRFKVPEMPTEQTGPLRRRRGSRIRLPRRREGFFPGGNWLLVTHPGLPPDILENEERKKERVRLLLDRYGILFRELLQKELPGLRWPNVFRSLRIMELSGEVLAGYFFKGVPGPQFMFPQAFRKLQRELPENVVYWINAADPASLCGVQWDGLRDPLPPRVASTHLIYHGKRMVGISKRNGRDLTFHVPPEDPDWPQYLELFRHLLTRSFQPLKRIVIETINGEKAHESPYVPGFRTSFEVLVDYKNVNLMRKMGTKG
jgi:ATP-dependent Lhr-like helicase